MIISFIFANDSNCIISCTGNYFSPLPHSLPSSVSPSSSSKTQHRSCVFAFAFANTNTRESLGGRRRGVHFVWLFTEEVQQRFIKDPCWEGQSPPRHISSKSPSLYTNVWLISDWPERAKGPIGWEGEGGSIRREDVLCRNKNATRQCGFISIPKTSCSCLSPWRGREKHTRCFILSENKLWGFGSSLHHKPQEMIMLND